MNVLWFSAGVSSAIAAWLCRDELDEIIYQHIDDQHPDSLRFLRDVEQLLGRKITVRQSPYRNVESVCRRYNYVNSNGFAKCTEVLKKRERKAWEYEADTDDFTYFWGIDCGEAGRCGGIENAMKKQKHRFPLIENSLVKQDCHAIAARLGLKRPAMYDLGYHNNNCIGCVKGGKGYWNKIRIDFPEVFAARAKMERDIGRSCINGVFLDELDPAAGRHDPPIEIECGIMCEINI